MARTGTAGFWLFHALIPFLVFILLAVLFGLTDVDLIVSDIFYDFRTASWPARNAWWAEHLIHRGGRKLILGIAIGSLALWGLSFFTEKLLSWRRAFLYLVLAIGLGTGLVALGKATINRHCPWDYDHYGGPVPYVGLFGPSPLGCAKGNCFPAGHASGGFSLMSSYFIFYGRNRRASWGSLALGILLGLLFGFAQVARGAHFVSHNICTAAICWFSGLALYAVIFRRRLWL